MKAKGLASWVVVGALVSHVAVARAAAADCTPEWLYGPDQGIPGLDGGVYAITTWDSDGPGPNPELLIVGGDFRIAGDVLANSIAAWDGGRWQPLGGGIDGSVYALTVYNGQLVAAGHFAIAGGVRANNVARWDGNQWNPLQSGIGGEYVGVYALTVYDGELIAAGDFSTAGDVTASGIARWDSTQWLTLVSAMDGAAYNALTVYRGELVAGARFTTSEGVVVYQTVRWDGTRWQSLGGVADDPFYEFAVYNDELVTGSVHYYRRASCQSHCPLGRHTVAAPRNRCRGRGSWYPDRLRWKAYRRRHFHECWRD